MTASEALRTDDDGERDSRAARRSRKGKAKVRASTDDVGAAGDDDRLQSREEGQGRQPLRRSDSTPAIPGRRSSGSGQPPRWGSSLWGIGSWLEAPLSASASSSGIDTTARRRSFASADENDHRLPPAGSIASEEESRTKHTRRRKRSKADSDGDSEGSSGESGSSSSGSSRSSDQDDDRSYRRLSRLELSGRLLFANRIFTPFGHPSFTASVPNLPSEVGVGVVGTSGLGGMEDVDTVDFEGGESESDEDSMAAAATAAASVAVEDLSPSKTSGNAKVTSSQNDQGIPQMDQSSDGSPAESTPTQTRQPADASAGEAQDYFGSAAGAGGRYEGGMSLQDYEPASSRGDNSGPMLEDDPELAEGKREAELREAREASAALQSSIEEAERVARLNETILGDDTGSAVSDEALPIPIADAARESRDDQAALEKKEQSLSHTGQELANAALSRTRKGRSSPANMFRSLLRLIRRAILAFVLAPYDAVTFALSAGMSNKRRKVEVSLKEPSLGVLESEKTALQASPGDEAPRKKKKLRSTVSRTRDDADSVDDVVTEEQAMERAERQRQAALALKEPGKAATSEEPPSTIAGGIASKLSKLLPNPHAVDPMLIHEPKAKKITGELPDEIVQRHQRSASLSLLKARAQAGTGTGSPETKATLAPGGIGTPPVAVSPAATPIPRSVVIHHTPKILVLDLDETLIHSTSRSPTWTALRAQHSSVNGRAEAARNVVTTGGSLLGLEGLGGLLGLTGSSNGRSVRPHMVEVVLDGRSVIYHVYKRPWVDYFLRKVSTWYQVVIFTASVQEYGDPVIDWLDQGRGLIAGRLYRDACTYKNGSYLKDLSIVDLDLSRVCLVDNSPASYFLNPCE